MDVSADRRQFILDIANSEWVDRLSQEAREDPEQLDRLEAEWNQKADEFLESDAAPAELHLYASYLNWDFGTEPLLKVASHRNCEAATALLIYWRGRPEWYLQYPTASAVPEHEREVFELLSFIEGRYVSGAYRVGSLEYDPVAEGEVGMYPDEAARLGRSVPAVMLNAVAT
jgi:hypothetical protein